MWSARFAIAVFTVLALGLFSPSNARAQEQDCLACHGTPGLFDGMDEPERLVIDREDFESSVHASLGLQCRNCHTEYVAFPHPDDAPASRCEACHGGPAESYAMGVHGYAFSRANDRAPTCSTCHTAHAVQRPDDPESPTHLGQVSELCGSCHGDAGLLTDEIVKLPEMYSTYAASVHGTRGEDGLPAASCVSCHASHDVRGPGDPASMISSVNVASTCGTCHTVIQDEYDRSIHGRARAAGVSDSPTCTGCHGEHLILAHDNPSAPTADAQLAIQTCGECHEDPVIIAKYSLQGGVVGSYEDSFHGWVTRGQAGQAATCVSCHNAHFVLPHSDPESTVSSDNVAATCGRCHERADAKFASSYDHVSASIDANPINRVIKLIYVVLIVVVIGGMVVHNLVILNFYVVEKRRREAGQKSLLRLDRSQIIQHLALTLSFILLVITGFALRYPDATWVRVLADLGLTEGVRALAHRGAAIVLVVTSLVHGYYIVAVRRGREEFREMLPRVKDIGDATANVGFHLWRRKAPARFGRYDYTQKAEYWALVWGTAIMALTGFVLWFPDWALRLFPYWIVGASQTVHFYEAWLATLAILVWHGFFVMVHPDQYPMSWTWLTGRMTEEEARHHHPEWVESLEDDDET